MEKTTMSVQELSAQMGISLPKAYELVKIPGFPTIRIGARILIPIEAYKESQCLADLDLQLLLFSLCGLQQSKENYVQTRDTGWEI